MWWTRIKTEEPQNLNVSKEMSGKVDSSKQDKVYLKVGSVSADIIRANGRMNANKVNFICYWNLE